MAVLDRDSLKAVIRFSPTPQGYDALPPDVREKVDGRKAVQVYDYDGGVLEPRKMVAPEEGMSLTHPLAPASSHGRKALYVNRFDDDHIGRPAARGKRPAARANVRDHRAPDHLRSTAGASRRAALGQPLHIARTARFQSEENRWMRRVTIQGDRPS